MNNITRKLIKELPENPEKVKIGIETNGPTVCCNGIDKQIYSINQVVDGALWLVFRINFYNERMKKALQVSQELRKYYEEKGVKVEIMKPEPHYYPI